MKRLLLCSILSVAALLGKNESKAQSTYFKEGFNEGTTFPTTLAEAQPPSYRYSDTSGTWYVYGAYRTTGATGSCPAASGNSHIRFGNISAADSGYLITPVLNFGVNTFTYTNGRAARRFTFFKTTDTLATTTNWTQVAHIPATNVACEVQTVTISDATAKRIKMVGRAGTDSDIDSIIITSTSTIVPVRFTSISALENSGKIQVSWNVATEANTARYAVERSTNGSSFTEVGNLSANNAGTYVFFDNTPVRGASFYRVRSIDKDGSSMYTSIVRINLVKGVGSFTIAPNPVKGNLVTLQLSSVSRGAYSVSITNSIGQQVFNKAISHEGGSATYQLQLPSSVKSGVYNLQVKDGETVINRKVVVE